MEACKRLWTDLTTKRLYVTGGLGPSARNEGFTADYDLPNETAYAETCAAVGLIFWAHRMLLVERDARYADMMELALYNGALSGLSLDGEHFFYDNPLASRGEHRRWTWHRCPCCPPNIGRLIASLGQYVYSTRAERSGGPSLHCGACAAVCRRRERLAQPDRPNILGKAPSGSGLTRNAQPNSRFVCASPAGAASRGCKINGVEIHLDPTMDRGYAHVSRRWQKGDEITLFLDMPAHRVYAHPGGLGRYRPRRAQARTDRLLHRGERQRRAGASDRAAAVQPHQCKVRTGLTVGGRHA